MSRIDALNFFFNPEFEEDVEIEKGKKKKMEWSNRDVKLLMKTYSDMEYQFQDKTLKQNICWENLADIMQACDCNVSAKQCSNKWVNLVATYKEIKDYNSKSGNNRKDWDFFQDMEEILGKKPEFNPVSLASSLSGFKRSAIIEKEDDTSDEDGDFFGPAQIHSKENEVKNKTKSANEMYTPSAKRQRALLESSVSNRQTKRNDRPQAQAIEILKGIREDRAAQFERTYQQRNLMLKILAKNQKN